MRIAVILSGCGAKDGSEIHEATLALYAIALHGGEYKIFAPDDSQADVVNHYTGQPTEEKRNIMVEAARIARGEIQPLQDLKVDEFDALLFPGGFGAAKNLFTFAFDGIHFNVRKEIEEIILQFHDKQKPIAAMCIAPVMLAKVLGKYNVKITTGEYNELSENLEKTFGAKVIAVPREGTVIDEKNKVITTPAYMYGDSSIANIGKGAEAMFVALKNML